MSAEPLGAEDMEFDDAVALLAQLLTRVGWPAEIVWIKHDQVLHFPLRSTIVFRPQPDDAAESHARAVFRERYGIAPAISFYAPAHDETRTFVSVEAIEELAAGEQMFVSDGLKIATQADVVLTHVTDSAFWWWFHRHSYQRWKQKTERALAGV